MANTFQKSSKKEKESAVDDMFKQASHGELIR
jgi:hypothetical protein